MLSSTTSMNKKMAFSQRYSFRSGNPVQNKRTGPSRKGVARVASKRLGAILGPGKRFIMRAFFVFSFSRGTFLGPRFHLSSKLIPIGGHFDQKAMFYQ